jgi:glycerate 2-kinase
MPIPQEGISLQNNQELTNALLKSGAAITEVNAVRKHLSAFKGGDSFRFSEKPFKVRI